MENTVLPIHFEDRSGIEFERLVFAYVLNVKDWDDIKWLGQTGKDRGRDIWGETGGESYCYQCANHRTLALRKVTGDVDKLVKGNNLPDNFVVVSGGPMTADLRREIETYGKTSGIKRIATWTGAEFEERLRKDTPELVKRFVHGEAFPDDPNELLKYVRSFSIANDKDIIDLLVECFDRPAFTTRFRDESSIPDFEKAVKKTIEVLNTGVHRLNDETIVRTIPSRHRITDRELKKEFADLTTEVIELRDAFTRLKKSGDIRRCGCGQVDCSTYMLSAKACREMDKRREEILLRLKEIKPDHNIHLHS
ncbi:MAG: hypothetical protein WDO15_04925 [Bacteroidota bacterium]